MKKTFLLVLFFPTLIFCQSTEIFKFEINDIKKGSKENQFYQFDNYSQYFFEDENYIVTKECRGEFGGYVHFKDKSSNIIYTCYADCAVTIIKQNGVYYLTTSLAHMIGFYGIYEITDPKQLTVKQSDVPYYSDKELSVGMKPLCYGMKKTILLSFVYNSKIYYIVSDQDGTHVAELNNNFLKKVQFLTNKKLLTYFEETRKTKDGHSVALLKVPPQEGYIDIFQNKIQIVLYK